VPLIPHVSVAVTVIVAEPRKVSPQAAFVVKLTVGGVVSGGVSF
jgi:hypothetical protein